MRRKFVFFPLPLGLQLQQYACMRHNGILSMPWHTVQAHYNTIFQVNLIIQITSITNFISASSERNSSCYMLPFHLYHSANSILTSYSVRWCYAETSQEWRSCFSSEEIPVLHHSFVRWYFPDFMKQAVWLKEGKDDEEFSPGWVYEWLRMSFSEKKGSDGEQIVENSN